MALMAPDKADLGQYEPVTRRRQRITIVIADPMIVSGHVVTTDAATYRRGANVLSATRDKVETREKHRMQG
jgi:hypothetical protein